MELRVLGPLEVVEGDREVPIPSRMQRSILAMLGLYRGAVAPRDRLIDELWGDSPPPTADHALNVHLTGLRQRVPGDRIQTVGGGYRLRMDDIDLDLDRFERLVAQGDEALRAGDALRAAERLRSAMALWRGEPLEDLAGEGSLRAERARLDELRLVVFERAIDAQLAAGQHAEAIPQLQRAVATSPLREGATVRLMLALYRDGRQAEALEAYRRTRAVLDDELGVEPGPELERMQSAILGHDPALQPDAADPKASLDTAPAVTPDPVREVVVTGFDDAGLADALEVAVDLVHDGERGLILARLVERDAAVFGAAVAELRLRRAGLRERGVTVRTATQTTDAWGPDLARLALRATADLIVVGGVQPDADGRLPEAVVTLLDQGAVQVALVIPGERVAPVGDAPILVPFGGADHDWAALELAAWLARARSTRLIIAGSMASSPVAGAAPDASRLIADACLVVQRMLAVDAEPALVEPSSSALAAAAETASHVILGLSDRWRDEGLGSFRAAVAAQSPGIVIATRRGLRPSGLAPREALTRFRWSIAPG